MTFRERTIESIASWLESKVNGEKRYPILEETPKGLTLEVGNILLKIANVSTQRMVINGTTKIFYNEDSLKNIKREFKIQQNLFKAISKQLKTQPTLRLRAPLSIYIEYKGVCCLATRCHQSETELASLDDELWQDEVSFLEGEGYKAEWF